MASRLIAIYYPERGERVEVMALVNEYAVREFQHGTRLYRQITPRNGKGELSPRHLVDTMEVKEFGALFGFTPQPSQEVQVFKQTLEAVPSLRPTMYREVLTYEKIVAPEAPTPETDRDSTERSEVESSPLSPTADAEGEPVRTASVEA